MLKWFRLFVVRVVLETRKPVLNPDNTQGWTPGFTGAGPRRFNLGFEPCLAAVWARRQDCKDFASIFFVPLEATMG